MNYLRAAGEAALAVVLLAGVLTGCGDVVTPGAVSAPGSSLIPVASPAPGSPLATPVSFDVPALGIHNASLIPLGTDATGHITVPSLNTPMQGGYWKASDPTADTPTVLLAHINAYGHAGLFQHLADLHAGDTVVVHRGDTSTTTYVIGGVVLVSKAGWTQTDTQTVYGDQGEQTIRLVSCGGPYNAAEHSYRDNVIAEGTKT